MQTRPIRPESPKKPEETASGATRPVQIPGEGYDLPPRHDPNGLTQAVPVQPPALPPIPPAIPPPGTRAPATHPPTPRPTLPPPDRDRIGGYQPMRKLPPRRRLGLPWKGCLTVLLSLAGIVLVLVILAIIAAFAFSPGKTNILVLGIDRIEGGTNPNLGRSDTMVVVQVDPLKPQISTLAIPRDLWIKLPSSAGGGENRINTAHFFAEANKAGSGPASAQQTILNNFGLATQAYVRIHLEGVPALVDAMGGVTIELKEATALYPAGKHYLDGKQALAFVRDRKNADDFFRMEHGEIFLKAAGQQMLNPLTWARLPLILAALPKAIDTNLPAAQWPALGLALLRVGPNNIKTNTMPREATNPTTIGGAQVLMPRWDRITPLVKQIFGN